MLSGYTEGTITSTHNSDEFQCMRTTISTPLIDFERLEELINGWHAVTTTELLTPDITVYDSYSRPESHKLEPMTCINCGGRIDRDDLTCCFCGTHYR